VKNAAPLKPNRTGVRSREVLLIAAVTWAVWRSRVQFDLDRVLDDLQATPMAGTVLRNFATRLIL